MKRVPQLKVKIFADSADLALIRGYAAHPWIRGFTTNPTLMRRAGVQEYDTFAREILTVVADRPVSFEVFADDFREMERQARKIADWAENVYVKIPVTNTRGQPSSELVRRLAYAGVKVNVTAVLTLDQVRDAAAALAGAGPAMISVFAGRIADTGRDPVPVIASALRLVSAHANIELIWASPRELLNVLQAEQAGCHIITATENILCKLPLLGKDLDEYSLETVRMFHRDAASSGYRI